MKKILLPLLAFIFSACSAAEPAPEPTFTAAPTFTATATLTALPTATPAPTETPAPAFEWKPLPDTPAELQKQAITAEELIKLVGSDDQEKILKWLKEQAAPKMDEINKNWTGPRANGLVTLGFPEQGNYTALGLSLDKTVSTREQVPIQVLGVQMIEGESPNVFFPVEWGKAEEYFKGEDKPVLVQLGILTNVIGEDGKPMTLTVTGITSHYAVLESKKAEANWDKWQTCLSDDGGEVPMIGFTFGSAGGDGLGNGFMKVLAFNLDSKGTFLSENRVGKMWMEAGNNGVLSDPHFRALKTPEDVAFWQKIFDTKGPFKMSCAEPDVFNKYKAK